MVSSLGTTTASGGAMAAPNGEMDPWADAIVTARFRFVQVSAFYDQLTDVPASRLSELPANPFGDWIAAKQPKIWNLPEAADQVAVVAVGVPSFATEVERVSPTALVGAGATAGPDLVADPNGAAWLVTAARAPRRPSASGSCSGRTGHLEHDDAVARHGCRGVRAGERSRDRCGSRDRGRWRRPSECRARSTAR